MDDTNPILDQEIQSLNHIEIIESEIDDELIQIDSFPLCFNAFQIVKGNLDHILVDNLRRR